jgi:tetrahydromethanopterin S-methyltransferase subunit B
MTSCTGEIAGHRIFWSVRLIAESIAIVVLLVAALPAAMEVSYVPFERIPARDTILVQA